MYLVFTFTLVNNGHQCSCEYKYNLSDWQREMGAKKEADKYLRQIPPGKRDRHIARKLQEREIQTTKYLLKDRCGDGGGDNCAEKLEMTHVK